MKIQELKYNLYLVDFVEVEREILYSFKKELDKFGILSFEDLPKTDYNKLIKYFTFLHLCKAYNSLLDKKNTIFYVDVSQTTPAILNFLKEIKKYFPISIYITRESFVKNNPALYTEITLKLKEFRYSLDYSKYSFNKIKNFCKVNNLDYLLTGFA